MATTHATVNGTMEHAHDAEAVLSKLDELVRGGIQHGYFEITITGGDAKAGHTAVTIKAGNNYRFVVRKQ